jgi:HK97 family phage major capsid protein
MELKILGKTINGDPATAVPEALAAVSVGLDEAFGKSTSNAEQVEKLSKIINDELLPQMAAVKAEQAALARVVPGPQAKDAPIHLRRESLRLVPQADAGDKDFAGLASMSREQFSVLTQPINKLTDDEATAKLLKRYRAMRDAAVVAHAYFSGHHSEFPNYQGWDSLPFAKELAETERRFQGTNALADGNSGNGAEWIRANVLSGSLIDRMDPYLELSGAFVSFPMEAATVKRAGRGTRVQTYLVAETTSDSGSTYNSATKSRFGTAERTFTAHKQGAFVTDSEEWEQDSIFNAAQNILDELAFGFAYDEEDVIVNGQHTTTVNESAPAAGSITLLADGIRAAYKNAVDNGLFSSTLSAGGGLTAETLALAWAQMGVFGKQPDGLWAVSSSGLARMMLAKSGDGVPIWMRADTLGSSSAAVTGALGAVYGRPVLMSSVIPETMDATGSIPDIAGSLTGIYHVNRRAFQKGERKGITLAASEHYLFALGQFAYRGIRRWDFEAMYAPTTYPLVNAVLSVPTA